MNSDFNNHQTDWLAQTEELKDIEASQFNGGAALGSKEQAEQASPNESSKTKRLACRKCPREPGGWGWS
jgi:hypothetical protein